jgi:hypothetical protein
MTRRNVGPVVTIVALVLLAAGVEFALGRAPICKCGVIKVWHGVVQSSENSQHLSDWYTPSHIVHGIWFYFFAWLVLRRWPTAWRLVIAVAIEAAWEVVENTPFVIDRYRAATISLDYYGDSIINSMSDIAAMMLGFTLAGRVRWWVSAIAILVMEIGVAMVIRDNLLLNILMLIHPFEAIKQWQAGG